MTRLRAMRADREDGTTALEFVLVFPVALFLLIVVIYGLLFGALRVIGEHAVRKAITKAEVQQTGGGWLPASGGTGCSGSATTVAGYVTSDVPTGGLLKNDPTTTTLSYDPDATGVGTKCTAQSGDVLQITTTFKTPAVADLAPLASLFGAFPLPSSITVSASGRVE